MGFARTAAFALGEDPGRLSAVVDDPEGIGRDWQDIDDRREGQAGLATEPWPGAAPTMVSITGASRCPEPFFTDSGESRSAALTS